MARDGRALDRKPGRAGALPSKVLRRRAFVLLALAGCLPRDRGRAGEGADGPRGASSPAGPAGAGEPAPVEAPASADEPVAGAVPPHLPRPRPQAPTAEALEARAAALRERYGPHGLTVLVERPFVLVGDEGLPALRRHAEGTVRWAVERLEAAYFQAPPPEIVEVWLLGTDESYRAHARAVFGDEPDTPYGYFTPTHQALVMNIATGGGTLVHEIVHPYVDGDFPGCPSWLDEGLASLYEQCRDRDGEIWGLPNWRLPGLRTTIEAKALPSFTALLSTTRDEFYEHDPGSNYAQARYLCLYLQEQGWLRAYYRDFRRDVARDPTGLHTLRAHVGDDLRAFQRRWERWVLGLRQG
jgi:hypothetical protein